jgi:hypothetical protein
MRSIHIHVSYKLLLLLYEIKRKGNRKRDHLEDPGIDGRITVRWIFRKWDGGHGLD